MAIAGKSGRRLLSKDRFLRMMNMRRLKGLLCRRSTRGSVKVDGARIV